LQCTAERSHANQGSEVYPASTADFRPPRSSKEAGVISDYLLKWRGSPTGFAPKVTAWSAACVTSDFAHKQLVRLLRGLVGSTQIVVLED
jgi:hypothetical protein